MNAKLKSADVVLAVQQDTANHLLRLILEAYSLLRRDKACDHRVKNSFFGQKEAHKCGTTMLAGFTFKLATELKQSGIRYMFEHGQLDNSNMRISIDGILQVFGRAPQMIQTLDSHENCNIGFKICDIARKIVNDIPQQLRDAHKLWLNEQCEKSRRWKKGTLSQPTPASVAPGKMDQNSQ